MIERTAEHMILNRAADYPIVTVSGPRQSGKSSLCQKLFPAKPYVNLELPSERRLATEEPEAFIGRFPNGAVIDEVQRVPDLFSVLQVRVDAQRRAGEFILTGSENLVLSHRVSQSLAGRTALVTLLPCDFEELQRFPNAPAAVFDVLARGGYPAIFDRNLDAVTWLDDYIATYVERDVRSLLNVSDLTTFQTFLRLAAGRTGQLLNVASLASDCGVSPNTARSWLSVLEAGYIIHRLPPFFTNESKRLVKMPKLYFWDTGLACRLLGIRTAEQVFQHPLRGAIFETWVVSDFLKAALHRGQRPQMTFYRDRKGKEIDIVVESPLGVTLIEVKSTTSIPDLRGAVPSAPEVLLDRGIRRRVLVHAGDQTVSTAGVDAVSFRDIAQLAVEAI